MKQYQCSYEIILTKKRMSRGFGIVEQKIEESEFFLSKLEETIDNSFFSNEPQYYLSAFASATRSITFTIQASISDICGFKEWYEPQQQKLKNNKLARYFLEARNLSQKIGYYLIGGGRSYVDEEGTNRTYYYFQTFSDDTLNYVPKEDILSCCRKYFSLLLEVVSDCYKTFGREIDPELFFTYENLVHSKRTIEDFEEQAGYPRGWTAIPGFSFKDQIDLISRHHSKPKINWVFEKYLRTDRYGKDVK